MININSNNVEAWNNHGNVKSLLYINIGIFVGNEPKLFIALLTLAIYKH